VECHRPAVAHRAICQNPVIEGSVYTIVIAIKGHRLYIYISIQQFRAPDLCPGTFVQNVLRASCEVNPQVFDTVLIPAAVGNLSGVNGKGLLQIFDVAAHTSGAMLRHNRNLLLKF
jgi:hypothetical protein